MNKNLQKKILVGGIFVTLSFLPGCALLDMFKGGTPAEEAIAEEGAIEVPLTGEVLVTMKGKPVVTTDTLAVEKEKFLKANPQIRQALGFMDPKAFDRNLLEGLIGQKIADEYVISQQINQSATYKAELKDLCESMERMLNAKYFSEQLTVTVPDSEVSAFYETNKDKLRGVMMSPGGVMAAGIEFDDGAMARAFIARAKVAPGGFRKIAQDDNAQVKEFKLVNNQSMGIDELLRDKIVNIKTVPSMEMFEVNGKFWVVSATSKEEPKYVPYEQVKDKLKKELEQNKRVELFEKEINELRKKYAVEVNEDYFKGGEMPQEMQEPIEPVSEIANATSKKDVSPKGVA